METKESYKSINYFLVTVKFIKNGHHEIVEKHGIKGSQPTSEHGHIKIKDSIKAMRKVNYRNDTISHPIISSSEPITEEQYEALAPYLKQ